MSGEDEMEDLKNRLQALKKKVKEFTPDKEKEIKEEIKELYIDIAHSLKSLNDAQNELRAIAQDFKRSKSSKLEVSKFYSFVKSQTSAELDLATLIDRAWNLIVMEDYSEAVKVLRRVLDIDPQNIKGLGFMGLALMNKGLYDDAMLYLQQVLLTDPDNPFALNNIGYICYKKGIWGEAIEHLVKAAKQTKDRMAALYANYYLGLVYYERSMLADAVKFFEKALQLGPNLQEAYYYLGLSETKQYEFKKAVEYFEKCIKIDKDSKYGNLCAEELNKIKPLIEPDKIFKKEDSAE
ncbi:MAG TPA: tetratricopeptide repeat protein [candidate division WOR-3 bacterium]|uniref:Tetratricopeptide repeat protein n=1 Tax=candidate division WOR-3 bacterium TaxID=2052148 RepID=A0A9C9K1D3_UNCW3|nr:tetratricopeptide repeat protein [candidate division WOR-3 bacterium]